MQQPAGAIYEAVVDFGVSGLVGTIGLTVLDNEGNVSVARFTSNIQELNAGVYSRVGNIAPSEPGQYTLRWDDGSLGVGHTAIEDLIITAGLAGPFPTVVTASSEICALWASVDDVMDCCADRVGTDETLIELALQQASELLYKLSGHKYAGTCEATVRPCASWNCCWTPTTGWCAADCGCQRLSRVRLAGFPVQQIVEVLIDGEVVDSSEYRLERGRELVRIADADGVVHTWPSCQRLDLNEGEGTFFVTYAYGENPPLSGITAAAQLACEIVRACPGADGSSGDCDLPAGTVRIARQGITIDTEALGVWLLGLQRTGLPLVDAFLSVYGSGRRRRTALFVPEQDPWPLRTG